MNEFPGSIGDATNGAQIADWVEALMFFEGIDSLSKSEIRRRLRPYLSGSPADEAIELMAGQISDRAQIAPSVYPFVWQNGVVGRIAEIDDRAYEFLLWASLPDTEFRVKKRWKTIDVHFDHLVLAAAKQYLGPGSEGVRFAWPPSGGRPSTFHEAIAWLATKLGLTRGIEEGHPHNKDGGADVVVWRSFGDGRPGFITLLIQATVREKWMGKKGDLHPRVWCGWIDFGPDPISALAIPHALLSDTPRFSEVRRSLNIIFDRLRLCQFVVVDEIQGVDHMAKWTARQRKLFEGPSTPKGGKSKRTPRPKSKKAK